MKKNSSKRMAAGALVILAALAALTGTLVARSQQRQQAEQAARPAPSDTDQSRTVPKLTVTTLATREQLNESWERLKQSPQIAPYLAGHHRLLGLSPAAEENDDKAQAPDPSLYTALVFDYDRNRLLKISARLGQTEPVAIREEENAAAVSATDEEYDEAVKLLLQNPRIAAAVANQELELFPAMPGVFDLPERTLAIGLKARAESQSSLPVGIAAVNLVRQGVLMRAQPDEHLRSVSEFVDQASDDTQVWMATDFTSADPGEMAVIEIGAVACDAPPANGHSSDAGAISQQINWGNWSFIVIRPKDSQPNSTQGGKGGGIELRSVYFKGKKVLHRAHVPILTAKYNAATGCGPYRDWQKENQFSARYAGAGIAYPNPAKTILETGSDAGNFNGVAIWQEWDSAIRNYRLMVVSEMEAGWYRYVQRWSFTNTGQLKPEYGFAAVRNDCTCINHTHHVYWRLDFDVVNGGYNRIREYRTTSSIGEDRVFEARRYRENGGAHSYRILNTLNPSEFVTLLAGVADNRTNNFTAADRFYQNGFAAGDVWFLSYKSNELYDGVTAITGSDAATRPQITRWANGERIDNADVVMWYAAHFNHDDEHGATPANHYVGPTIQTSW